MSCIKCESNRLLNICAKCSDLCYAQMLSTGKESDGYVVADVGLGTSGDYVDITYCLECGQIQGEFPVDKHSLEEEGDDD